MRATVAHWANLDPTIAAHAKVLQQWSSHSLRVGATNLLYANGFSAHQIQTVLRWRSLAFMTYFRNLTSVSDKHGRQYLLKHPLPANTSLTWLPFFLFLFSFFSGPHHPLAAPSRPPIPGTSVHCTAHASNHTAFQRSLQHGSRISGTRTSSHAFPSHPLPDYSLGTDGCIVAMH
jgi:hypothetical protein